MKLTDFDIYSSLLKEKSGLVLSEDKVYLLESRLNPIAKKWGYNSLETMTIALQGVPDKNLVTDIVEAMTHNDTSFFRDKDVFLTFKNELLAYFKTARAKKKKLRIWCAGCSSGQEPYTISIILKELEIDFLNWDIEIMASDISYDILDRARMGLYTQHETQRGLPVDLLLKYFTQIENQKWQISDTVKKGVTFRYFNLLDQMRTLGTFDLIFCRNVIGDFDSALQKSILDRMVQRLVPDGYLIMGKNENIDGMSDSLVAVPEYQDIYVPIDSAHLKPEQRAGKKPSPTNPLKPSPSVGGQSNRFFFSRKTNPPTKS